LGTSRRALFGCNGGGGGHSRLILEAAPDVQVTAVDRDEQAIAAAKNHLGKYGDRVQFFLSNFADYEPDNVSFDGVVADLGVSSTTWTHLNEALVFATQLG